MHLFVFETLVDDDADHNHRDDENGRRDACQQLGRDFRGLLRTQTTPNPNFRRIDAVVRDAQGNVLVSISTVLGRY